MGKIKPVIIAGGIGSRLWPISRESCPKQFIKIFNNKSLMQLTLERNKIFGKQLVIINKEHYDIARLQAQEVNVDVDFIIEPTGRNTAPCAITASLSNEYDDTVILLPADHYIENIEEYTKAIYQAVEKVGENIITFGIVPTTLHTGYGYIKTSTNIESNIFKVSQFVEKPSIKDAYSYIARENYYWNAGIFVFKPKTMLKLASNNSPTMHAEVTNAFAHSVREENALFLHKSYNKIAPDSIDFAFMENADNLLMIKANFDWHDLGGWKSLWDVYDKDEVGNTTLGDVELYDTSNSYIHSDGRLTAVIGVNDIIVVNTADASLIVHKSRAEDVKHLVQNLVAKDRIEVRKNMSDM